MESPTSPAAEPAAAPTARKSRRAGGIVLVLVLLLVLAGRWLSPNLTVGVGVTDRWCDASGGFCVEHVERGEWLLLAPVDEFHVIQDGAPRYYTADNPFGADPEVTVTFGGVSGESGGSGEGGGGVSVSDGSAVLNWPAATLVRLGD